MNPMAEQNVITVRRLADLDPYPAVQMCWEGRLLRLELESDAGAVALAEGTCLVEVDSGEMVLLGEARGCQGRVLTVNVEHALDRNRLSRVQEAWNVQDRS
jgi:hypothetical protein